MYDTRKGNGHLRKHRAAGRCRIIFQTHGHSIGFLSIAGEGSTATTRTADVYSTIVHQNIGLRCVTATSLTPLDALTTKIERFPV